MIGHTIINLIFNSGIVSGNDTEGFCWFLSHMEVMYIMFVPYSLLIFMVDRLVFIKDPNGYAQRWNKIVLIIMFAFPWVLSTVVAFSIVITTSDVEPNKVYLPIYNTSSNFTNDRPAPFYVSRQTCTLSRETVLFQHHWVIAGLAFFPEIMFVLFIIIVLVMWCLYKRKHAWGRDYSMFGQEIERVVERAVIAVCTLGAASVILTLLTSVAGRLGRRFLFDQYTVFGLVQGVIFLATFKNARSIIIGCCCCRCCRLKALRGTEAIYNANNESVDILDQRQLGSSDSPHEDTA